MPLRSEGDTVAQQTFEDIYSSGSIIKKVVIVGGITATVCLAAPAAIATTVGVEVRLVQLVQQLH